jgi:hypothetical protein
MLVPSPRAESASNKLNKLFNRNKVQKLFARTQPKPLTAEEAVLTEQCTKALQTLDETTSKQLSGEEASYCIDKTL